MSADIAVAGANGEIVPEMTEAEARTLSDAIKRGAAQLYMMVGQMKKGYGWKALGYADWSACCAGEWGHSESYSGRLVNAAAVALRIGEEINERQARELTKLPADQQKACWEDYRDSCEARGVTPTASGLSSLVGTWEGDNEPVDTTPHGDEPGEPSESTPSVAECMRDANRELETFARRITSMASEALALDNGHLDDRMDIIEAQLKTAASTVRAAKGAGPCSYCQSAGCKHCHDTGWLDGVSLDSAPPIF